MEHRDAEKSSSEKATKPLGKKIYESPRLVEWGSLTDLTHGAQFAGKADFPFKGGTRGV